MTRMDSNRTLLGGLAFVLGYAVVGCTTGGHSLGSEAQPGDGTGGKANGTLDASDNTGGHAGAGGSAEGTGDGGAGAHEAGAADHLPDAEGAGGALDAAGPTDGCGRPVDAEGFYHGALGSYCGVGVCPEKEANMLASLDCTLVAPPIASKLGGKVRTVGCGRDVITDYSYEDSFHMQYDFISWYYDSATGAFTGVRGVIPRPIDWASCGAYRFIDGQVAPPCADVVTYQCTDK